MRFDRYQELEALSGWFGIDVNYFEKKKGIRAFADAVMYLTHKSDKEQLKGKFLYLDEEVKLYSNKFSTYTELENYFTNKNALLKRKISKKELREKVLYEGWSIRYLKNHYKSEYDDDMDALIKRRGDYLKDAPMPPFRFNIFITGDGGSGKGFFSEALCWALIDNDNELDDEDIFCYIGSESVGFEMYDGQSILLWDDVRHQELIKKLGTRGNLFNVFDTKPKRIPQRKKYSQANLVNTINIVNSVEDIFDFLDGLAGEYKDRDTGEIVEAEDKQKSQSYRRFPIRIQVFKDCYDLYFCAGFFDKTKSFLETENVLHINAPITDLVNECGMDKKLYHSMCKKAMKPIVDLYKKAKEIYIKNFMPCAEDVKLKFADLGLPGNQEELPTIYIKKIQDFYSDALDSGSPIDVGNITYLFCNKYNIVDDLKTILIYEHFDAIHKAFSQKNERT